jgi:hypothetical protein
MDLFNARRCELRKLPFLPLPLIGSETTGHSIITPNLLELELNERSILGSAGVYLTRKPQSRKRGGGAVLLVSC